MTFAPPPPPKTAHNQQVEIDYNALSPVNDLSAYRDLFFSVTAIAEAMDYATLPAPVRAAIWDAIDAAETAGSVEELVFAGANGRPVDYSTDPFARPANESTNFPPTVVFLLAAEARASFGAKVAHTLKHEIDNTFPWSISEYPVDWMRGLLDPNQLFRAGYASTWDPVGDETQMQHVIDYSPAQSYAIASAHWNTPTAKSALEAFGNLQGFDRYAEESRFCEWQHASVAPPEDLTVAMCPEDALNLLAFRNEYDLNPPNPPIIPDPKRPVSSGCHYMCRWMVAVGRAINIPGFRGIGYFVAPRNHATAFWPSLGLVSNHGDDCYSFEYGTAAFVPLEDYQPIYDAHGDAYPYPVANNSDDEALRDKTAEQYWRQTMRYFWLTNWRRGEIVRDWFCPPDGSWSRVDYEMSNGELGTTLISAQEKTKFRQDLEQITGCDGEGTYVPPPVPMGTITIDPGSGGWFVAWAISPDPVDPEDAAGYGARSFDAVPGDYTITWGDTWPYYDPPVPPTEGPTTLADGATITFGPPTYTLTPGVP